MNFVDNYFPTTGHWADVVERNKPVVKTLLRTMSENPALEWNTGREEREEAGDVVLVPLLYNLHLKLMVAPAVVYRRFQGAQATDVLVAGLLRGRKRLTKLD